MREISHDETEPGGARESAGSARRPPEALIPLHFFVLGVVSFALGVGAMPFTVAVAESFFYQPLILALVHTFALGWVTSVMIAVLYRYVPALTRTPLRYPRLCVPQLALYFIGVSGMITHFARGEWLGVWSAAIVVLLSLGLFAVNMAGCLWRHVGKAVTESVLAGAITFLIAAGLIGFVLAFDKRYSIIGGTTISNIAGHAHIAAVGWLLLTTIALSYRMLPAFVGAKSIPARVAAIQQFGLAAAVPALAICLFARLNTTLLSAIIAIAVGWYALTLARIMRSRRVPMRWAEFHVAAGLASFVLASGAGLFLTRLGAASDIGSRVSLAYGLFGLSGFSNFIIGVSYHLLPGLVSRARSARHWITIPMNQLAPRGPHLMIFAAFNSGILICVSGFLAESIATAEIGAVFIAIGGVIFSVRTLQLISLGYRRATSASA